MSELWDYTFSVWPDEENPRWTHHTFTLFQYLADKITMRFRERAFNTFREELAKVGLTLREIERVPAHTPETIL